MKGRSNAKKLQPGPFSGTASMEPPVHGPVVVERKPEGRP
jgi:hypothetical protein